MSSKKYIDIIIPTKNRNDKLKECLNALSKSLNNNKVGNVYNTIIVKEHDTKHPEHEFFQLLKHPNYRNLNISYIVKKAASGFTSSLNLGLKRSLAKKHKPDYIGFLHDDTIVFKGWLESLLDPLEKNVNMYGAGSITANELDEQCISKAYKLFNIDEDDFNFNDFKNVTDETDDFINSKLEKLEPYEFYKENKDDDGYISLFSCLFRTSAFEKFGNFDENLISSFRVEDEFCKRLIKNGKYIALIPNSFVLHECFSLSFNNVNLKSDKILRDATVHNIKIKYELNTEQGKRKKYVVYSYLDCVETPILENIFNYHDTTNTSFICFSNRDAILSETWESIDIRPFLEIEMFKKSDKIFKEFIKLHPHYFFKNFNASVWIDFDHINMLPFDIDNFIKLFNEDSLFLSLESNEFTCSWEYLVSRFQDDGLINTHTNSLILNGESNESVLSSYRFYNFPQGSGFMDTSVLAIKHNNENAILILNKIWKKYLDVAKDDKLWFNFMIWLYKKNYDSIPINIYQLKMNEVKNEINKLIKGNGDKNE